MYKTHEMRYLAENEGLSDGQLQTLADYAESEDYKEIVQMSLEELHDLFIEYIYWNRDEDMN